MSEEQKKLIEKYASSIIGLVVEHCTADGASGLQDLGVEYDGKADIESELKDFLAEMEENK